MDVRVRGLTELRNELRRIDPKLTKAITIANKVVAGKLASVSQAKIPGLPSPGGSRATSGVRPRATQQSARIVLLGSNPTIRANVLGTLSHGGGRHRSGVVPGRGPWQPWLGRNWTTDQLYGVGEAAKDVADTFAPEEYATALMVALKGAFPN